MSDNTKRSSTRKKLSIDRQAASPAGADAVSDRSYPKNKTLTQRRSRSGRVLAGNEYYATAPANLQYLLASELENCGATAIKVAGSGVRFNGPLEVAYRACLWSRVANRVLMPIAMSPVTTPESLYQCICETDWSEHLDDSQTLAVDFFCSQSEITHSQYGALKVKDAIVDQFRNQSGIRPSVNRETPDVRVNVYLHRNQARTSIDLSGTSLHRRSYRSEDVKAPLKENIAAALLLAADWPTAASRGHPFYDPMCGSGTFLIEAAMIASDTAPGIQRDYFGFLGWKKHDPSLWNSIIEDAHQRTSVGRENLPNITGSDIDHNTVTAATENIRAAGFDNLIHVTHSDFTSVGPDAENLSSRNGLVLSNPPYGRRLDTVATGTLYSDIGQQLKTHFPGWQVGLLVPNEGLYHRLRLDVEPALEVSNGGIDCKLLLGVLDSAGRATEITTAKPEDNPMFANRLTKNLKAAAKWSRKQSIAAYRLYDADMPEYAVAIDVYHCNNPGDQTEDTPLSRYVVVQEYQPPANVDPIRAAERLQTVMRDVPVVLDCPKEQVYLKVRKRQRGARQYLRESEDGSEHVILEGGARLRVNLQDYLDTGLFLDHRKVRTYIQQNSQNKRFLNLFAYTGTSTVHAALGGAKQSLSIDLSTRYLQWAQRNLQENNADLPQHELLKTDVLQWLADSTHGLQYDLILLDPPTFSNSTSMETAWDVQRDHIRIIKQTLALLAPQGLLIFSTNFRRFKMDTQSLSDFHIEDRSRWSIDNDFQRNPRIHQCWFIKHAPT